MQRIKAFDTSTLELYWITYRILYSSTRLQSRFNYFLLAFYFIQTISIPHELVHNVSTNNNPNHHHLSHENESSPPKPHSENETETKITILYFRYNTHSRFEPHLIPGFIPLLPQRNILLHRPHSRRTPLPVRTFSILESTSPRLTFVILNGSRTSAQCF